MYRGLACGEKVVNRHNPRGWKYLAVVLLAALLMGGCSSESPLEQQAVEEFQSKQRVEEHVRRAKDFQGKREYRSAVIELKNALLLDFGHAEAHQLLGEVYLAMGYGAAAEKEIRRAEQGGIDSETLLISLGEALRLQHSWQRLLDTIQPSQALPAAQQARIYALRGLAHLGQKEREAAGEAFTRGLEIDSSSALALLGQVRLAMDDGRTATARQLVKRALQHADGADAAEAWGLMADLERKENNLEEAEDAYSKAIELSFNANSLRINRALVRIDRKDYAGAAEDLDKAARIDPDNPEVLYGQGLLAIREQRYADAQGFLEKLKDIAPDHLLGMYYLGVAHIARGDLQQAETFLSRVANRVPQSFSTARLLGLVRYRLEDFERAAEILEPLLVQQSDDPEILAALGNIYIARGDLQRGREFLQRALLLQPNATAERVLLGLSLLRLGENEQAVKELEQGIGQTPEGQGRILLVLGHIKSRNFSAAREVIAQMRAEAPAGHDPWNALGLVQVAEGDIEQARESFIRALQLRPGDLVAGHNLAQLELHRGQPDRAQRFYREVLEHNPDHLMTLMALARLREEQGYKDEARSLVERAMTLHPEELEPRIWLARGHLAENAPLKTIALLQEIQNKYPDSPILLTLLGQAQLAVDETSNAVHNLRKLAELMPEQASAQYLLAQACAENKEPPCLREALILGLHLSPEYGGAPELINRLLEMTHFDAEVDIILGRLQKAAPELLLLFDLQGQHALKQNHLRKAVKIYQEAQERAPNQWLWVERLSQVQAKAGDLDAASATLENWLRLHPNDVRAHYLLANNHLLGGRHDAALGLYNQVLDQQPDHALAMNNVAWLLRDREPQKALVLAERAVELQPNFATRDTLGVILLKVGQSERAMQILQQAFAEQPQSPDIRYHLAMALMSQGQPNQARELLQEVIDSDSMFAERNQAEVLLIRLTQESL